MSDETNGGGADQRPVPPPAQPPVQRPVTPPFDWGVGHAADSAPAAPRAPEPYFTSDSDVEASVPEAPVTEAPGPAAPAPEEPVAAAPDQESALSPIDALFGETRFKDYEGEPLIGPIPTELNPFAPPKDAPADPAPVIETGPSAPDAAETVALAASGAAAAPATTVLPAGGSPLPPARPGMPHEPLSKNQRILFWVAGGGLAALVLILLFVIGTKFAPHTEPTPAAAISKSPSVTPTPTPTVAPAGPAAVGVHKWSDLRGGECLDPFTNPFAENFTVVDCAAAHPAQMVFRGTFPAAPPASPAATPSPSAGATDGDYPGLEALQTQINLLCTAPGVIDLATAGAYSDIQFQAAYAANAAEWKSGQHDYFCFVNRSGGEPLTGSVAGTPAG